MKILIQIDSFYPAWAFGGGPRCAYEISKELVKRGHEVTVYTTNAFDGKKTLKVSEPMYILDGVKVYYFRNIVYWPRMHAFISPGMIRATKKEIQNFDVIHLHGYRNFNSIFIHKYAKKWDKPYILSAHGAVVPIFGKVVLKKMFDRIFGLRILKDAVKLIAISNAEREEYKKIGAQESKIVIIPNGINGDLFHQFPSPGTFKNKFNIFEKNVILYVGRVHQLKGLAFLLKAFAKLDSEDVKLVIAGPDDGYMPTAMKIARRLRISDRVLFTGFLTEGEKLAAYVDSTVVVFLDIFNVFGLIPLEAALCEKPVIVSNHCGMAEMVETGRFGFSVNYGDVVSLNSHIKSLLNDQNLAIRLGQQGRKFITKNFTWKKMVDQLESVYYEVIDSHVGYCGKK